MSEATSRRTRRAPKSYQHPIEVSRIEEIWRRGEITPLELMRIVAWKSALGLAEVTVNDESSIRSATRSAIVAVSFLRDTNVVTQRHSVDWTAWRGAAADAIGSKSAATGLLGLRGIGYPVATAVLATLLPNVFPVMDRYAISEIFGTTLRDAKSPNWHTADYYTEYCRRLVGSEASEMRAKTSVHERDKVAMNAGMKKALAK